MAETTTPTKSKKIWYWIGGIIAFLIIVGGVIYYKLVYKPKAQAKEYFSQIVAMYNAAPAGTPVDQSGEFTIASYDLSTLGYNVTIDESSQTLSLFKGNNLIAEATYKK